MPPSRRTASPRAAALPSPSPRPGFRVSQRPPTACRECSLRKVRCDKRTPCGRCARLAKPCTREVVRISKALSGHRDELRFLQSLRARLFSGDGEAEGEDASDNARRAAIGDIDARVRLLEHGKPGGVHEAEDDGGIMETVEHDDLPAEQGEGSTCSVPALASAPSTSHPETSASHSLESGSSQTSRTASQPFRRTLAAGPDHSSHNSLDTTNRKASILTGFEFLAWGRYSQTCFPHRRCRCYQNRRYSELASINCDPAWIGRQSVAMHADPDTLLPPHVANRVVRFHMDYLHWHHNAFHGPTFLDRCRVFWSTGTVDHPLWLALYYAVCSVSLWTLLNNEQHRTAIGYAFDETLVERQFEGMVATLYAENFLENLSLYAVQAIVVSTRIAHNLDRTDLNAILVGAAVRIAHCLGLHKIADPPDEDAAVGSAAFNWHERVEIETGKRVWMQLVIQDHFQIVQTDTYVIHPSQYITPRPKNCSDYDMVEQPPDVATNSSYVRMLGRTASLMPHLLDGLGPMAARKPPAEAYQHILACDRAMRANVAKIPEFLLREDTAAGSHSRNACVPWLPLARRTLAISAAEKTIMIHRPVLFDSFQSAAFRLTRTTCVAAATTILREHEQAVSEQAVSIWTHSAFCVTAAVVLGLELFHRTDHTDDLAHSYRQMLLRAADRLRRRHADAIAERGALLIDTMLAAEEDLVLRMMRTARSASGTTLEEHQRAIINDMIGSHEIMARFLAIAPQRPAGSVASTPLGGGGVQTLTTSPQAQVLSLPVAGMAPSGTAPLAATTSNMGTGGPGRDGDMDTLLAAMDIDMGQDFESWFNNVFAPVYDPLV